MLHETAGAVSCSNAKRTHAHRCTRMRASQLRHRPHRFAGPVESASRLQWTFESVAAALPRCVWARSVGGPCAEATTLGRKAATTGALGGTRILNPQDRSIDVLGFQLSGQSYAARGHDRPKLTPKPIPRVGAPRSSGARRGSSDLEAVEPHDCVSGGASDKMGPRSRRSIGACRSQAPIKILRAASVAISVATFSRA